MKNIIYYVTMQDTYLHEKLAIQCNSYEEAEIVKDNADHRTDMKYVNIRSTKPSLKDRTLKTEEDMRAWFKPNYFRDYNKNRGDK